MRTYQLIKQTLPVTGNFSIYIESISDAMNCDDFLEYLEEYNKDRISNIFKEINHEYLNSLRIGNTMVKACYNIYVSYIPVKMRTYTLDNGNDLFPEDYNVSSLNEFKTILTTFYNLIVKNTCHLISIKLEDIIDTKYLTSLQAGPYPNEIQYYFVNDIGAKIDTTPQYIYIYVSEFEVE